MTLEHVRIVKNKLNQLKRKGISRREAREEAKKWANSTYGFDPATLLIILKLIQLLLPLIFPEN